MLRLIESHFWDLLRLVSDDRLACLCALSASCRASCRACQHLPPVLHLSWAHAAGKALTPQLCATAVSWMQQRAASVTLRLRECMPRAEEFRIFTSCLALRELECMGTLLSDQTIAAAFATSKPLLQKVALSHCSECVTKRSVAGIAASCPALKHLRLSHVQVEADLSLLRSAAERAAAGTASLVPVCLLDIREPRATSDASDYCIIFRAGPDSDPLHVEAPEKATLNEMKRLEVSSFCWPDNAPRAQQGLLRLPRRDDRRVELRKAQEAWDFARRLRCGSVLVEALRKVYADKSLRLLRVRGPPAARRSRNDSPAGAQRGCKASWAWI